MVSIRQGWRTIKYTRTMLFAGAFAFLLLLLCALHFAVLPYVDRMRNAVLDPGPYSVPDEVLDFHNNAFVADLHTDSLLWCRDLDMRQSRGHVDVPRLLDGGVDLQVFSVVTQVPLHRNYQLTADGADSLPLLFIACWRPVSTWFGLRERALVQADSMRRLARETPLTLVLRRNDLSIDGLKGVLALEGMHALEGRAEALQELYSAGFRIMGLVHHFDNEVAGSAHGRDKYGLTGFGRALVPEMEALGITIDLAHASPAAVRDTLDIATRPVIVSHTGVQGTCPGPRNLSDNQLRMIAGNGGVIGIGYWKSAVCDTGIAGIVAAILHVIKVAGIEHVGLGSDFDGDVTAPFDTAALPRLTGALLSAGLSDEDVSKILGDNVRRVLENNLPE